MTTAAKYLVLILKNKKARNTLIGIITGIIVFFIMIIFFYLYVLQGNSSEAANIAVKEYEYWQNHTPEDAGFSCQGEKYCSYFNFGVVDWCCFFAGYCYEEAGIDDSGYASVTNTWTENLKSKGKLKTAASGYTPRVGNPVFFNYDGRANYASTNFVAHVGVVVEVKDNTITVIAGNE